jgi:hypothetical protein
MSIEGEPKSGQVSIRKSTKAGIAAELVSILSAITDDGVISDAEIQQLQSWVEHNHDGSLPAITFLRETLGRILEDGKITKEERKALYKAIERVLPAELRHSANAKRIANELVEKAHKEDERSQAREERDRNRVVLSANFMVAGVLYDGRAMVIDRFLKDLQAVFWFGSRTTSSTPMRSGSTSWKVTTSGMFHGMRRPEWLVFWTRTSSRSPIARKSSKDDRRRSRLFR